MMKLSTVFICSLVVILGLASLGLPGIAAAHGTGYQLLTDAPVVAAKFYYSDQTPMKYAEVLVFSPLDGKIEHQNGRTDKNGKFFFCPDSIGQWRILVNDGMGHAVEAAIPLGPEVMAGVTERPGPGPASGGTDPLSKLLKIIAGFSFILNVSFIAYFLKRRSK
jgi:nickel transport protein